MNRLIESMRSFVEMDESKASEYLEVKKSYQAMKESLAKMKELKASNWYKMESDRGEKKRFDAVIENLEKAVKDAAVLAAGLAVMSGK